MKKRLVLALVIAGFAAITIGVQVWAAGPKLPKCSAVRCRDLGCPADVLCTSGTSVKTCAEVCNR